MAMSRKDYVAIATAIKRARLANTTRGHAAGIDDAAILIAAELQADNPRFDRSRFLNACGVMV